jgi:hypothetical protein
MHRGTASELVTSSSRGRELGMDVVGGCEEDADDLILLDVVAEEELLEELLCSLDDLFASVRVE